MDNNSHLRQGKKLNELTSDGFAHLLTTLHQDRDTAARAYEEIRQALIVYFALRRVLDPHDLADEVFNRVARRLSEGRTLTTEDPARYFYGVARNVWLETYNQASTTVILSEEVLRVAPLSPSPESLQQLAEQQAHDEKRLACLRNCLNNQFSPQDRELLTSYYQLSGQAKILHRQQLAARFGMTGKALRNKISRLRLKLIKQVQQLMNEDY